MNNAATPFQITIISAGAGSGKTYTLTGRMVDMLRAGVRASGIIATTFTQKAAAELQERVRVRLLESGMNAEANELGSALIGTVHSIGVRLLQRFAFEAGVSPLVEIIADGDERRLFNESLAQVLGNERIETLNRLADRLGLTKKGFGEPYDWRDEIRRLTDVARANNFDRQVLETSKKRSFEQFARYLPEPQDTDARTWNNRLTSLIDQTVAAIDAQDIDETKTTREAAEALRILQHQLQLRGELYWYEWVKISKVKIGAKSRDLFEPLRQFALSHGEHRDFRADIRLYIELLFDIAADALDEYEEYKKKRGLIDYTDMETWVSRLLRIDAVRDTLRGEIDLLLVDEFQDTSPIQLDIFLQLSRLARHSIWVGDPKQSIYGFRGAEPALMQAIVEATGGIRSENILKDSWRSRADIVHASNAIFTRAFDNMPPEQVTLDPVFTRDKERAAAGELPNALIHWHFNSESDERRVPGAPWLENCIAEQIGVLLARQTPVFNKKRNQIRPVQPGDIAVLCRNNTDCARMAEALHRCGLRASIARTGLLETPEARLVLACLKYLITASDALSAAEIQLLSGASALGELVENRLEYLHRQAGQRREAEAQGQVYRENRSEPWAENNPLLRQLNELRPFTAELSASEILNLLLDELDLRRVAVRLGEATQRLDNIDRLRRYALDYESACNRLHSAASLSGFLLWLNDLGKSGLDLQGSGESADAVKVMTYHKSKGLEFPVTVCHNIDSNLKERIWGLQLVSERDQPDLDNILGNRWMRFWVNPYADQARGTLLEEALAESPEWMQATRQACAEEARLLYVGITRARDYLVFPTTPKGAKWLNRVYNQGDEDIPTLDPNSDETPFLCNGEVLYTQTELLLRPRDFPEATPDETPVAFHAPRAGRKMLPGLPKQIYTAGEVSGIEARLADPLPFAPWLEFQGDFSPEIEKTVRSVLKAVAQTADDPAAAQVIARRQLDIRGTADALRPDLLARHALQFRQWLDTQLECRRITARYPLEYRADGRVFQTEIDLFCAGESRVDMLFFAGFAEGMKKWKVQAEALAHVCAWCEKALQSQQLAQRHYWVVFPIEGQVVEILIG